MRHEFESGSDGGAMTRNYTFIDSTCIDAIARANLNLLLHQASL